MCLNFSDIFQWLQTTMYIHLVKHPNYPIKTYICMYACSLY